MKNTIKGRETAEKTYWKTSTEEKPGPLTLPNFLNKMADASVFMEEAAGVETLIPEQGAALELGAGQGWAACILKKTHPSLSVHAADISDAALSSLDHWERIFEVRLTGACAARSAALPYADACFAFIFTFASAHHFTEPEATLREIARVLTPNGHCVWLYEPCAPQWLYPLAFRRLNRRRPLCPEDVLVPAAVIAQAQQAGLETTVHRRPSYRRRAPLETAYYYVLSRLPFLTRILPCTTTFVFSRDNHP